MSGVAMREDMARRRGASRTDTVSGRDRPAGVAAGSRPRPERLPECVEALMEAADDLAKRRDSDNRVTKDG